MEARSRQTGQFVGAKETVFQNVLRWKDAAKGLVEYRPDILEQRTGYWVPSCPSTQGGKNWQAMSYDPATGLLVIPLSQSCMDMNGRVVEPKDGSGGTMADRRFFEMPGSERQYRQARRLRRPHHGAEMGLPAARRRS